MMFTGQRLDDSKCLLIYMARSCFSGSAEGEFDFDLRDGVQAVSGSSTIWPAVDQLIILGDRPPSALWTYRSKALSFVLPVMSGGSADYLVSPRQPGVFEQPVSGPPR